MPRTPQQNSDVPENGNPELRWLEKADAPRGEDFEVFEDDVSAGPEQGALFSADELFLPAQPGTYRKPVAAIHAIPVRRDVTLKLSARKLMDALALAVQLDLRARGREAAQTLVRKIREDRATPLFEIRTHRLAELAGLSTTNKERIHETLAELVGFRFIWNVLNEDGKAQFEAIAPFIIRRDKGVGSQAGVTRFAFEPDILLWFLEPTMWASLNWTVMAGLGREAGAGHEAAFGLYQNVWRYIGTYAKLTPVFDLATWIDLILGPSRFVIVGAKGEKQPREYGEFKRTYLTPAMALLNAHPALTHTIRVEEFKSGRKIARLRFHFNEKRQQAFELPLGWPEDTVKRLAELGFSEKDMATLSQLYAYPQVTEALKRLPTSEARMRARGEIVQSRNAFFRAILRNVSNEQAQTEEADQKALEEARRLQEQTEVQQRTEALQSRFAAHQRNLLANGLRDLPEDDRSRLIQAHLKARPQDKAMYKEGETRAAWLILFQQWIASARQDLFQQWLPAPHDREFQAWLVWQLAMQPDIAARG
ncbi:replication initiation protein (plasmid) [Paraburkholderia acidicola]|uniref:Replication initiation protein n=1 Tax=Paraburkholderia acidicola TaxID=1912599 RepID=A0ABV1LYF3_9BURK